MAAKSQYQVSIIIPTYNRSRLLGYTLDSIAGQKLESDLYEVIVVDDGSSDDTASVVDSYRSRLNLQYFFQPDKGNRAALARNVGIENARGSVCLFVDAGMILGSDCVAQHLSTHLLHPSPVAVIGYVYCFNQFNELAEDIIQVIRVDDPDGTIASFRGVDKYLDLRENNYRKYNYRLDELPAPWVFYWTCNVSAPRAALFEAGLFDTNFDLSWGFEDVELGYRLYRQGVPIVLSPNAEAIHYPHDKEEKEYKIKSEAQNKTYFHKKYGTSETELYMISCWDDLNDKLLNNSVYVSDHLL